MLSIVELTMTDESIFPVPGTVLWGMDIDLEREVFRSGAASKPNVEYLRFLDLGLAEEGRIPDTLRETMMVAPGQGISLFLQRMIPEGLTLYDPALAGEVEKKKIKKIHWWGIEQGRPIPAGLQLVYDGQPPGHCTLSVVRQMPVSAFLSLVATITFNPSGIDLVVPL
ncbi:hypothetical protein SRABI118_01054 [Massilia sp. Bi118]|uniref:hypothetical protein n=1 Tax=Massilia sp. Bi118 TaxID=2822346 RepID=UPI001D999A85|nr:hypothetical protein [Massilia sp. Bi118]CAH0173512.1 hypothetical protein SRABI118_01054 [Massilia sp. Bi118]